MGTMCQGCSLELQLSMTTKLEAFIRLSSMIINVNQEVSLHRVAIL